MSMVRPEVVEYLRANCGRYSDKALRERLIRDGIPVEEVDKAFAIVALSYRPATATNPGRRAKAPESAAEAASAASHEARTVVLFIAGMILIGLIAGVNMLMDKIKSPGAKRLLAKMQTHAEGPGARAALPSEAPLKDSVGQLPAAEEGFRLNATLAYQSILAKKNVEAIRYADLALASWNRGHGADIKKSLFGIRARAYELSGKNALALSDYQAVSDIDPRDLSALSGRGRIFTALKDFKRAAEEAAKMIELAPEMPESYAAAAAAYNDMGDVRQALNALTRAIQTADDAGWVSHRSKELADLFYNRGAIHANEKSLARAVADMTRAIELNPREGRYYAARSQVFRAKGDNRLSSMDAERAKEYSLLAKEGGDMKPDPALGLGQTIFK